MRRVISLSFPEELADKLEKAAKETKMTKSEIVKLALWSFLWEGRFNKARKTIAPKAKKQGFVIDEDVFRNIS